MYSFSPFKFILLGITLAVLLSSCSSSSHTERYNKPVDNDSEVSDSSVRFTSKEKKKEESLQTFNAVNDDSSEFDVPPIEDDPVDTRAFVEKHDQIKSLSTALTKREKILIEIISYLDTPYKYGGVTRNGIDCSAFTRTVYERALGTDLPRTASEQFRLGKKIKNKKNLEFGDLIFFNTSKRSYPGHVGIYLGEDMFAHASRSLGVTVSSLNSSYYARRYIGGRRVN